ncbi:MAG: nucleoside triphosphate pyrophosphohydrolase [Candidatus Thorarchaeota archaeon]|nr:nucleoside triphosphate pyrophosphohydrolase [Candidatus Thorarchaeota archaeon]
MINEKLVRDGIPELIRASGEEPEYRTVTGKELDLYLRKKIVEEATELVESGSIDELVDILEVVDAFMNLRKVDTGLIEMQRHAKRLARGGFDEGFVLKMKE